MVFSVNSVEETTNLGISLGKILKPGDIVLDIGANIGYYSVLFSKIVTDTGKVLCFEPTKHYRDVLSDNLKCNQLTNCEVYSYGLSNENHSMKINIGVHSATMHWVGDEKPIKIEDIYLKRLDDVIDSFGIDKIDFIKIDIDGHESACLEGAWETIQKYKPIILLEVNHANYLKAGVTAWDFYAWLIERDFNIYSEDNLKEINNLDEFLLLCGNFAYSANIVVSQKPL